MTVNKGTKIVILISWLVICLLYYINSYDRFYSAASTIIRINNREREIYNNTYKGTEKYLINTPGCYIPNYSKTLKFKEAQFLNKDCGIRAIYINKKSINKIEFKIDKAKINTYSHGKTYQCCVKFAAPRRTAGKIDLTQLKYSSCTQFRNGSIIQLEEEIVTVSCHSKSISIYEDVYILLKKQTVNNIQKESSENPWNVLILGMDTMSRARLLSSMPKTAEYLRDNDWLDFRGYQKVGYNTFPNVMALMTGMNVSSIYQACSKGMSKCSKLILWNNFKEAGYVTAYGEDFLRLPDTFTKFDGFRVSPTDHYMRPFFLTGETKAGSYVCTKKVSSVNHLLDYAYQFSDAYKNHMYYGFFWINSCSHEPISNPTLYDQDFVTFFKKLQNDGLMDNTFIIFISDHGIRYGSMRVPAESYYEERLPMCHVWVPKKFRELYSKEYINLHQNADKMVTPYDLYLTMWNILKITQGSNEVTTSEACPLCKSMFEEVSPYRNCADAGVNEKWCSCHDMSAIDKNESDVISSLQVATANLAKRAANTKTKECTECYTLKLKTTLRSHTYADPTQNKTFYVVAFLVDPGSVGYEAVVQKHNNEFSIVQSIDSISPYNTRGSCVNNVNDRPFCLCKELEKCKIKVKKKNKDGNRNFIT